MTPKEERILTYLRKHKKGITSLDAINKLGETRLSATIYLLRQKTLMKLLKIDMVRILTLRDIFYLKQKRDKNSVIKEFTIIFLIILTM